MTKQPNGFYDIIDKERVAQGIPEAETVYYIVGIPQWWWVEPTSDFEIYSENGRIVLFTDLNEFYKKNSELRLTPKPKLDWWGFVSLGKKGELKL